MFVQFGHRRRDRSQKGHYSFRIPDEPVEQKRSVLVGHETRVALHGDEIFVHVILDAEADFGTLIAEGPSGVSYHALRLIVLRHYGFLVKGTRVGEGPLSRKLRKTF